MSEPKRGKAIDGIWYSDALAENNIESYDEYKNEAVRLALKMGKYKAICTDTVSDSFKDKLPVGDAAKIATMTLCTGKLDFKF
jgi:hypothetical protein